MKYKALIVEDSHDIARLVQMHLRDIHCEADLCHDGASALRRYQQGNYDLIILDLMLPEEDGLSLCRKLRAQPAAHYVPILMLTAKSSELDRVLGLEVGADDYLSKPFSIPELLARIKALFRRVEALSNHYSAHQTEYLLFDELSIHLSKRQVCVGNREIALTAKEFDLLLAFASHPGRVYTRSELLDKVWGYHHLGYEHTVNSHINRLRAKIELDAANPRYIKTVWGVGYKFTEQTIGSH